MYFHLLVSPSGFLTASVGFEHPRLRKFAKLVADHIFRYVNRHESLPVVDIEIQSHEFWGDRRSARPSLNWFAVISVLGLLHFGHQVWIDKETFFN